MLTPSQYRCSPKKGEGICGGCGGLRSVVNCHLKETATTETRWEAHSTFKTIIFVGLS